jgi:hypothetical protein
VLVLIPRPPSSEHSDPHHHSTESKIPSIRGSTVLGLPLSRPGDLEFFEEEEEEEDNIRRKIIRPRPFKRIWEALAAGVRRRISMD